MKNPLIEKNCSICGSKLIREGKYSRDIICPQCKTVYNEINLDYSPEWRAFDQEETKTKRRTGPGNTILLHDKGRGAKIDQRNMDSHGKKIDFKLKTIFSRLRKYDNQSKAKNNDERALRYAIDEIRRIKNNLDLPQYIQTQSVYLYKKTREHDLERGINRDTLIAAIVLLCCRRNNLPFRAIEIAEIVDKDQNRVLTRAREVKKALDMDPGRVPLKKFVPKYLDQLGYNFDFIKQDVYKILEEHEVRSSSRFTFLAYAIWKAAKTKVGLSQEKVSKTVKVTNTSIRNARNRLKKETKSIT